MGGTNIWGVAAMATSSELIGHYRGVQTHIWTDRVQNLFSHLFLKAITALQLLYYMGVRLGIFP